MPNTIYIAADHGGYQMKEKLKKYLESKNFEVVDMGPFHYDPGDDYPAFAFEVAKAVAGDEKSVGVLLCRSGQGVCIVANKVAGIRACLAWNEEVAIESKNDNHANVLCLPSDYIDNKEAEKIADAWLDADPSSEERHKRRVQEISAIEQHLSNR